MLELDIFYGGNWQGLIKMMVYFIPILMVGILAFSVIRIRRQRVTAKMFHCTAIVRDKTEKRIESTNEAEYWIVFEMLDGEHKKLLVAEGLYKILEINDRGSLSYRGKQMLSFKRRVC